MLELDPAPEYEKVRTLLRNDQDIIGHFKWSYQHRTYPYPRKT